MNTPRKIASTVLMGLALVASSPNKAEGQEIPEATQSPTREIPIPTEGHHTTAPTQIKDYLPQQVDPFTQGPAREKLPDLKPRFQEALTRLGLQIAVIDPNFKTEDPSTAVLQATFKLGGKSE